jgi:hypothetical protein
MMPVSPAPEPAEFDKTVRVPGLRSIYEKTGQPVPKVYKRQGGKPFKQEYRIEKDAQGKEQRQLITSPEELSGDAFAPYWTEAIDWLLSAYNRICMYSCFRIHPATGAATVDHMVPKSRSWQAVYEWSNYRLAGSLLNARKNDLVSILDPFDVQSGWFQLNLVTGAICPGEATHNAPELRQRIQAAIERLGLNDFTLERRRDIEDYETGALSLRRLEEESPFVAAEIRRQGLPQGLR